MSWKDNIVVRTAKNYALSVVFSVASLFGGGSAKAATSESTNDVNEAKIEVVTPQQSQDNRRTYSYTRATLPQRQANRTQQNQQQNNRTPQNQNKTHKVSKNVQSIKNYYNNTKNAINNIGNQVRRNVEVSGANFVYKMYYDYIRQCNLARANAQQKKLSDKKFSQDFAIVVANALIVKHQIDNGKDLYDYIPHNTRQSIDATATQHAKNIYKMMRKNTNEDIILEYMGNALAGVAYTPSTHKYEYNGLQATISGNLIKEMNIKSKNYTIGGNRAYTGR